MSSASGRAAQISALLFDADPIGLNFTINTDEYDSEAKEVDRVLDSSSSVEALTVTIRDIFLEWFNAEADLVGPLERYAGAAAQIWELRS
ncbi:MAG: hypothetical protein FWD85_01210 [Microbacteriaceae bacterium]|nr:hypothetical protein [Microbacteriaceae bacterium]MCL2793906.1 hypothetical protein [Microbacteriaceae bacterium]